VTGTALAHCILGKFLGVVCHCFPPPLDVPTFTARCLYIRNDARDPSSERWNCGREICIALLKRRDFLAVIAINGRIIVKCILKKQFWKMWTAFIFL